MASMLCKLGTILVEMANLSVKTNQLTVWFRRMLRYPFSKTCDRAIDFSRYRRRPISVEGPRVRVLVSRSEDQNDL